MLAWLVQILANLTQPGEGEFAGGAAASGYSLLRAVRFAAGVGYDASVHDANLGPMQPPFEEKVSYGI
jgi:hypothetical protein